MQRNLKLFRSTFMKLHETSFDPHVTLAQCTSLCRGDNLSYPDFNCSRAPLEAQSKCAFNSFAISALNSIE